MVKENVTALILLALCSAFDTAYEKLHHVTFQPCFGVMQISSISHTSGVTRGVGTQGQGILTEPPGKKI